MVGGFVVEPLAIGVYFAFAPCCSLDTKCGQYAYIIHFSSRSDGIGWCYGDFTCQYGDDGFLEYYCVFWSVFLRWIFGAEKDV